MKILFLLLLIVNCYRIPDLVEGGYYSVLGPGGYNSVKILKIEEGIIHITLFANFYRKRPDALEIKNFSILNLKDVNDIIDKDGNIKIGLQHLAVNQSEFILWKPKYIGNGTVEEKELKYLHEWEKSGKKIYTPFLPKEETSGEVK